MAGPRFTIQHRSRRVKMKNDSLLLSERVRILNNLVTSTLCLMAVSPACGQVWPPTAERVFKNVQVLKGIPVDQFLATMGFISASLGMTCTDCHISESGGNWERYADDTKLKQTTRKMLAMVSTLNRTYFGGRREVTCYSCHRGGDRVKS